MKENSTAMDRIMLPDSKRIAAKPAHVIVVGNEEDGFGKPSAALHIAVGLMKNGQRVAAIDVDGGDNSLTYHFESRRAWSRQVSIDLPIPLHHRIGAAAEATAASDAAETSAFESVIAALEHTHEFVLIGSPRADSALARLAHSRADTVVTPLIDSFLDIEALGTVDAATRAVMSVSPYAAMVQKVRRQRRLLVGRSSDWIVLRERPTSINSENRQLMAMKLSRLAGLLGFRMAPGICEPVIYRELLPRGLTALDTLDEGTLGAPPGPLQQAAQEEVRGLIESLKLPLDRHRHRHADARAAWAAACATPLESDEVFAA